MRIVLRAAVLAAMVAGPALAEPDVGKPAPDAPAAQIPQAGQPDVATLLFSGSQWKNAPVGSVISYDYAKKVADTSFGPSFNDHVTLKLDKGDDADDRAVEVKMFSGANARAAGPFPSAEQNPVLLLVLEENVQELSQNFHANPRYLKNAIRKAWRDSPSITPVQLDIDGKSVPGTRITVQPFRGDAEAERMKGLDTMTYTVDVSAAAPGMIAAMDIRAPAEGAATFSEQLRYQGIKQP